MISIKKHCLTAASLIALTAVIPFSAAFAQNADTGEVIVTAQKRSENLQKASISVDVLRGNDIAAKGITSALNLQEVVPTVKFTAAHTPTVSIRGLGTTNLNPGVDAAVATSIDGIYIARAYGLPPVLFDLKRVEAVLGPQGTLYGRNSNAGVVNFISNDPNTDHFGGSIQLGAGNYGAFSSELALNIPFNDTVALRISGGSERHDGYNDDGSFDKNAWGARAKLLIRPSDDFRIMLSADYAKVDEFGGTYSGYCAPGTSGLQYFVPGVGLTPSNCIGVQTHNWTGLLNAGTDSFNKNEITGYALDIQKDFSLFSVTSLTGYRTNDYSNHMAAPQIPGVPSAGRFHFEAADQSKTWSEELRFNSLASSRVKWVAGLYYSVEDDAPDGQNLLFDFMGANIATIQTKGDFTSSAVFADLTFPVTDSFRIRAGIRYTEEEKKSAASIITNPVAEFVFGIPDENVSNEIKTDKTTWKIGFDYDLTPNNLLYATYSTGFKSGGVNAMPASFPISKTYAPEEIEAIEIGTKNRFFNNKLQVNAAYFHYDYTGFQTYFFYFPSPGVGPYFPTLNSQTATFQGGELDVNWRVTSNDTLGLHANFLDNKYDRFVVPAAGIDYSGHEVANSPKSTISLNWEHRAELANGNEVKFNIDTKFVSEFYVDNSNEAYTIQPSYQQTGASLTYRDFANNWSATAYVRNLENEAVMNALATGGFPGPGIDSNQSVFYLNPPRTYGVTVRKDF